MSKKNLTPWYPANVRPARKGVYEVRSIFFDSPNYRYWNGKGWGFTYSTPFAAYNSTCVAYRHNEALGGWRGLAKKP